MYIYISCIYIYIIYIYIYKLPNLVLYPVKVRVWT